MFGLEKQQLIALLTGSARDTDTLEKVLTLGQETRPGLISVLDHSDAKLNRGYG